MSRMRLLSLLVAVGMMVLSGCGTGEEETKATSTSSQVQTPQPTSTSATAVTPTAAAKSAEHIITGGSPGGTILSKAIKAPDYELDDVKYGGTFTFTFDSDVPNWDPKVTVSGAMGGFGRWFYQKLLYWAPSKNSNEPYLAPQLAEKWEVSSDLRTYTFSLKKGIKWQNISPVNGREFVADDVVFNYNRFREPDAGVVPQYGQIESVTAPDKYTVVIKIKEANAFLMNDMHQRAEWLVAPEVVKEGGGTITTKVIGTGPYIMRDWGNRRGGLGVKNPDYWEKDSKGNILPYTDEVKWTYVVDKATVLAAFRTGQVDYPQIGTEDVPNILKSLPNSRLYFLGAPTALSGTTFNSKNAPWSDVRVRRAVAMALDQKTLAEISYGELPWDYAGPFGWHHVSDDTFDKDKLGPYLQYNPQESKKFLIDAGFPDGKLKVATGWSCISPCNSETTQQSLLKQHGIEVELAPTDGANYRNAYYLRNGKDISTTHQNTGDFSLNWYAQNKFRKDGAQNTAWIDDPEIEKVVSAIKKTQDPIKIREYAKVLWDYDTLNVYNIWRPYTYSYDVMSSRVRNWTVRHGTYATGGQILPWLADARKN